MTYNEIDQRMHLLSQSLARINRTYIPAKPDDSHTNLGIDIAHSTLMGHWISIENDQLLPCIDLGKFAFIVLGRNLKTRHRIELDGINFNELLNQIEIVFQDIPTQGMNFRDPMHYEIPDYPFKDEPFHKLSRLELEHWMHWRAISKRVCQDFLSSVSISGDVRIWPHHFDTGILVNASDEHQIGIGLAMEDKLVEEAYFYVASYRKDLEIPFKYAPQLQKGRWISEGNWKGAVLPIHLLNGHSDLSDVQAFVFRAIEWFVELDTDEGYL